MVSKGLGDTIEKIAKATGIKKAVETVSKAVEKDCGCNKRKDTLNRIFPYQKTTNPKSFPAPNLRRVRKIEE